jgi:hypothetical protein
MGSREEAQGRTNGALRKRDGRMEGGKMGRGSHLSVNAADDMTEWQPAEGLTEDLAQHAVVLGLHLAIEAVHFVHRCAFVVAAR